MAKTCVTVIETAPPFSLVKIGNEKIKLHKGNSILLKGIISVFYYFHMVKSFENNTQLKVNNI